ncbi:MAG: FAD-binding protein, partial [Legionella sp.]
MVFPANLQGQFIAFLDQNKIFRSAGWNNFMETVDNAAAVVVEVTTVEQLQNVLKEIKRINELPTSKGKITVRATGGWSDDNVSQCCLFPWSQKQINTYNEGFSFSQVVGGRATPETPGTDVILRFAKKYHHMEVLGSLPTPKQTNPESPIHKLPCSLVKVSAGVQVAELVEFLRKKGLSLTTVSMISWVTAVGLAGTGGHGTGRDEPAFSGLIESFEVCDMDGNLREITSTDPDFQVLSGAHSGLLGVVTSIKIRAVEAYNLKETIRLFSNVSDMDDKLDEILKENQYVSIMGMPTYGNTSSS